MTQGAKWPVIPNGRFSLDPESQNSNDSGARDGLY